MNLILVSIGNFQEYILDNIQQLIKLNTPNIYVITNKDFFHYFDKYIQNIHLINVEQLDEPYNFFNNTILDKQFRNGFWTFTSLRFFYIYSLMKKYNLENCIHIENDVLLYYNIEQLHDKLVDKNCIFIPFDTFKRNIASIVYIPNHIIFKQVLDQYNFTKNDMENFALIKYRFPDLIKLFPIFPNKYATTQEEQFVSENYNLFECIFDAAAIGQFIGGVDPRNIAGDSRGFINETCVIKYNKYDIYFKETDGIKKPFIKINNNEIPIFNLHIHSKKLHLYY
jgi:hypothetical protein